MKKILALAGAGALVLSLVVPVMARHRSDNDVDVGNWAVVKTNVTTQANTGGNSIGGKVVRGGRINTGEAAAGSLLTTQVNYNEVSCSDCEGDVKVSNWAVVKTNVTTQANTGGNSIGGKYVCGGTVKTGDASSGSEVYTVVNTNLVGE